jgi:8-oxo-dGTP pyrophosphatase MutT (NUDIX family)
MIVAAGIFIVRKDKKLLVCHPTNHKPNFWSIPKGRLESGETPIQGALRETYEECNIDLKDTDEFDIYQMDPVNYKKHKIIHPFLYFEKLDSKINWLNIELKCNSFVPISIGGFPEMDDFKWVDLEDSKYMLHYTQASCIDTILNIVSQ